MILKVGSIVRLTVPILQNQAGSVGICHSIYNTVSAAFIFHNGNYDGFSPDEQESMLKYIGFEPSLSGYIFTNVMKLSEDYHNGYFNKVFSDYWVPKERVTKTIHFRG